MPKLSFSHIVKFTPEQMLSLVADLYSYPDFVPNCTGMEVRDEGDNTKLALMDVNFGPISQSYTSRVVIDEKLMSVHSEALDGPFSYLDSLWKFASEGEGTRVKLEIDFEIANPLIASIVEPAFANKQDEIMDAFMDEANRRYG
ncbi:MAG: type II toxin-antitoxin system RatA family toxin [Devosiaceae bacterium]|nr:type II toxin-antitoxin system RatA family toxin [Devosiaceae bacterium]